MEIGWKCSGNRVEVQSGSSMEVKWPFSATIATYYGGFLGPLPSFSFPPTSIAFPSHFHPISISLPSYFHPTEHVQMITMCPWAQHGASSYCVMHNHGAIASWDQDSSIWPSKDVFEARLAYTVWLYPVFIQRRAWRSTLLSLGYLAKCKHLLASYLCFSYVDESLLWHNLAVTYGSYTPLRCNQIHLFQLANNFYRAWGKGTYTSDDHYQN